MQRPMAFPLYPGLPGFGTPLRRFGNATRATQTLGIEWLDAAKKAADDLGATWAALAAARSPAEVLAIQTAYLHRAGERIAARSALAGNAVLGLTGDLLPAKRPSGEAAGSGHAH